MDFNKYLERYAEPESVLADAIDTVYDRVVVIPVFNEPDFELSRVLPDTSDLRILLIIVLNRPDEDADLLSIEQTLAFAEKIKRSYQLIQSIDPAMGLYRIEHQPVVDCLLVERCHEHNTIPYRQGVGLARKIGCDIASHLIARHCVTSPWIHSLDADVSIGPGYYEASGNLDSKDVAAGIYTFRHIRPSSEKLLLCQMLYDLSLHYYVSGLRFAGSPYAFHTIGSTLLLNARHYCQVRGFPKRNAAEDFYLLNKMAKVGQIVSLTTEPVLIDSRQSNRVPFGTGPALISLMQMSDPFTEFRYYHPRVFRYLGTLLQRTRRFWNQHDRSKGLLTAQLLNTGPFPSGLSPGILNETLEALGFEKALDHALQHSNSLGLFEKHFGDWFDAFRTLKFIHYLRDRHIPSVTLAEMRNDPEQELDMVLSEHIKKNCARKPDAALQGGL